MGLGQRQFGRETWKMILIRNIKLRPKEGDKELAIMLILLLFLG